jgi:hypothetical protein
MLASAEHEGVSSAHGPYGRAMSIFDAMEAGHAESPQAKEQAAAAAGVPSGRTENAVVGP